MSSQMKAITDAVMRSSPKLERPRMSTEAEHRLYQSDRERAVAYAMVEDVTEQIRAVVDEIEAAADGVPVFVDDEEENSLVTTIESLRRSADAIR